MDRVLHTIGPMKCRAACFGVIALVAGWAGCTGNIGDGEDGASESPSAAELGVGPMGMRRLSVYEYDNTLRDLLDDDTRPAVTLLPEDTLTPFDNDFESQQPSRVLVESAETLAKDVAERLVADVPRRDDAMGCRLVSVTDEPCLSSFVEDFGRRAFRRPLSADEVTDYVTLATSMNSDPQATLYTGVELIVRAMLQDANYLYRIELGTPVEGQPGLFLLNDWEIGTRMSYLIWGSTPDDELLDLAQAGKLVDAEGRRAAALRMLEDPRALRQVDRFHAMWMSYEKMPLPADLTNSMRVETAALIERVVFQDQASWLQLFQATETFVDDTLAAHYGLPAPGSSTPQWVDTSGSDRRGLLSHGSFLSAASNPADTSPTKRGVLVRKRLMCETIPDPDPSAPADNPPDPSLGNCKIDQYAANRAKGASCDNCHANFDPIGFGLENYTISGQFRAHDDGKPECTITGDGEVTGVGTFNGPSELADLLVQGDTLDACAVQHLFQFAMGRETLPDDGAFVSGLRGDFRDSGHRFDELVLALVVNEAFGYRVEMTVEE